MGCGSSQAAIPAIPSGSPKSDNAVAPSKTKASSQVTEPVAAPPSQPASTSDKQDIAASGAAQSRDTPPVILEAPPAVAPAVEVGSSESDVALRASVLEALSASKASPGSSSDLVAQALAAHPNASVLDLRNCSLVPDGGAAVASALGDNTNLRRVDLSGNDIGSEEDEAFDALAAALKTNSSLQDLDLSSTGLGRKGANVLAMALAANKSLLRLVLSGNSGVGDEGASVLGAGIAANVGLQELVMTGSDIGDEGATFFAAALQSNSTMSSLDLSGNTIGAEGAKELAAAVRERVGMVNLDLSGNPSIGDVGAGYIAEALADPNITLLRLKLGSCSIGDEGAEALAEAIVDDSTLVLLNLQGNPAIGEAGRAAFAGKGKLEVLL